MGDHLVVVLRNELSMDINISPDGGLLAQHDREAGDAVAPGDTFTYDWIIPTQVRGIAGLHTCMSAPSKPIPGGGGWRGRCPAQRRSQSWHMPAPSKPSIVIPPVSTALV